MAAKVSQCAFLRMAPKRSEKIRAKKAKETKEAAPEAAKPETDADLSPADVLRNNGIITNFAQTAGKIHRNVRDICVSNLSVTFHGTPLVDDTELTLNYGNRYGFIGRNGCGKSTFMKVIAAKCFPIPEGIDIFHVEEEIEASDMSAKEAVMSVDVERNRLEKEAEALNDLMAEEGREDAEEIMDRLTQIYERLDEMDASTAEARASKILTGLGFTAEKQAQPTRSFSGGWRMRIALARALFIQPALLLLDEPTNHLDMEAVVWLEDYLSKWNKILFMVSHSQDFMNNVCTHIVHLKKKKLHYYTGNYDSFVQTRAEVEEEQMKRYKWEQDQIKQMKEYIARFGHGTAKNAKQAQSKEKTLEKMVRGGLTDKVDHERVMDFKFSDPGKLTPPVLQCTNVTFGYPGGNVLYANVDFGIDLDSRIALVGPNGAGKSTLLKLMTGDLIPVTGSVRPHPHLRISKFSQHFIDVLDLSVCPLDYFLSLWPDMTREEGRKFLGRFGISGNVQTQIIGHLSDGQKSRVVLAKMAKENPHLLFLDEPTNHLDMESIDSLARAINNFEGGMVLVSHDMRLISQVAKEIWVCDNMTIAKYQGEISDFKMQLRRQMDIDGTGKSTGGPTLIPLTSTGYAATSEEDEVMKARMELADMAIRKQRERQEKEAAEKAAAAKAAESAKNEAAEAEEAARLEKEAAKARRRAEKEAAAALAQREAEEREQRRLEKLKDMEDAKKLKEAEAAARAKKAQELAEAEAKKAAEEAAIQAELAVQAQARKEEKARRKAQKALEVKQREEKKRADWIAAARQDVWTQEQQDKLENALLDVPIPTVNETAQKEKENKWNFVAAAVGDKTRNQCLMRYRLILEMMDDRKRGGVN